MANVRIGAIKGIRNKIYTKILTLPLSFFSRHKKGDIIARVTTDVQEVEYSIMNYLEMIVRDPVTIIAYIAFMVSMSPKLTLFVLIILPITGLLIGQIGKSLRKQSKIGMTLFAGLLSNIEESISGLRIIKAFNAIDYSDDKFRYNNRIYSRVLLWIYRKRDLSSPLSEFMSSIVIIIVLWFGGRMVLSDSPTIQAADFITYIVIFSQIIPPAKTLHLLISQNKLSIGNIRFQIIVSDSTNMFFAWIVPHKYPSRELYEMGVKTETINIERINPNIKAFDSKLKDQLDEIRKQNNLYELLLIDGNMNVTEGSKSNIFFIKGTTLYSPPLNQVLPGITRKMIIKIAKENDIEFVEKVIKLNDLNSFASVFLSGTSPKILPINRINNHTYQTKNDIMSLISKSYNKTLDEYVTSFKWSNYE